MDLYENSTTGCDECDRKGVHVVALGELIPGETHPQHICAECLRGALLLIPGTVLIPLPEATGPGVEMVPGEMHKSGAAEERDAAYEHLRWLAAGLKDNPKDSVKARLETGTATAKRKALYDAATDIRNGVHRKGRR